MNNVPPSKPNEGAAADPSRTTSETSPAQAESTTANSDQKPNQGGGRGGGKGGNGEQRKRQGPARRAARLAAQEKSKAENLPRIAKDTTPQKGEKQGQLQRQQRQKQQAKDKPFTPPPRPTVGPSQMRSRHWSILSSLVFFVVLPTLLAAWYLWTRAADQYASDVGFSVREEQSTSGIELLSGLSGLGGTGSSNADILYKFLQSQDLVAKIDRELDLRALWSKGDPDRDPIFAYDPPGTIEDLVDHWPGKVKIYYDSGTGLTEMKVLAFDPNDAQMIAKAVLAEGTRMINDLSSNSQEDAIRIARADLERALERLKKARQAITTFRSRNQLVDPTIDTSGQMGLVNNLQLNLAEALIELGLLKDTTRENDPRITNLERKVQVIETQIAVERQKLGFVGDTGGSEGIGLIVGQYEGLIVDREFAETSYTAAITAFEAARAEAARQSLYLATHIQPTLAEKAEYPQRVKLISLITIFLFLAWTVYVLVVYSLRDRR
ncbi:MAG: capsule biosynthesis protein [Paracoccaceae bacterium]|nr:capsule biosynthesis protein [Paracoccaceae bacterium]